MPARGDDAIPAHLHAPSRGAALTAACALLALVPKLPAAVRAAGGGC